MAAEKYSLEVCYLGHRSLHAELMDKVAAGELSFNAFRVAFGFEPFDCVEADGLVPHGYMVPSRSDPGVVYSWGRSDGSCGHAECCGERVGDGV